ncbi:MAG: dicarboxylate/amino acid:cation symporter [Eubacteriales bacterium]|nr:dicarboxylate/amino acid:cation symporter [Eubacteriales bacterium]
MSETKKKKKLGLTTTIFLALLAGAVCGSLLHRFAADVPFVQNVLVNGVFYVAGQGFIRLMQMLVVPLVFCSLVCGAAAIGDTKTLGKVGVKTIGFYLVTTMLAISVALGVARLINPGRGLDMSQVQAAETAAPAASLSFADTLLNIIPKNPIGALAGGDMLPIILFALIIGVILAKLQDKVQLVTNFFQQGNDIMMEMTMMVMRLAPVGVFCLISKTFSELGVEAMKPMFKYMVCVLLALVLQCLGVYQLLLAAFTRLNPLKFIRKFAPVMGFAFSTATSNATIPLSIETLEDKMGVSRRISSFTVPLGATINMDGTSIMQGVAVVFVAQAFGIALTPADYLTVIATATLASIGTAGVPSVGLVTLAMVFDSVGLPVAGIGLIMGIDRILDMARTAVNITGDAVCTTIVAHQDGALDRAVFDK